MIDTQVFGFRYSSVLTPRRNAMPGHRVTTTAFTTTVRSRRRPPATEKTAAARCQACRWRAVVYDGSIAFFPGLMFFVQALAPLCGIVGTCLLPKWGEELAPGG